MAPTMIAVEADTPDLALWKACLILDCAPDDVFYAEAESNTARVRINALALSAITDADTLPEPPEETSEPIPLKPLKRIDDDITPTEGRLVHFGDIAIYGTVRSGAHVRARGKITVWGDVEHSASVIASESIIIKGGHLGTARAVRGDIHCRYASGAAIVGRNITIIEDALQCRIASTGKIDVGGMLCGGVANATSAIDAAIIGAPKSAAPTRLTAGKLASHRLFTRFADKIRKKPMSEFADHFLAANTARLEFAGVELVDAHITAHTAIYPCSHVQVGQASLAIDREMRQATFWNDPATGILMMSHHEYT